MSNLMLMDRGLVSDMQFIKTELGPAEFLTGTCVVPGAGCRVAGVGAELADGWRGVWDSVRAGSPESRDGQ